MFESMDGMDDEGESVAPEKYYHFHLRVKYTVKFSVKK